VVSRVSLRANIVYLTVEKAVHTLGGLVSMVLVARYLGGQALADYGFAISATAFFIPLLDLGMNNRLIKSVAAGEAIGQALSSATTYKVTVAPLVLAGMLGVGWVSPSGDVLAAVVLMGLSTLAMSLGDAANSAFKGLQLSHVSCWLVGSLNLLLIGSLYGVLSVGHGLVSIAACYAVTRALYAIGAFVVLSRYRPNSILLPSIRLDWVAIRSGWLHLPGIYYLGNLLYLSYLATYLVAPHEAGMFYVGYRAASATYVLVSAGFEAVLANAVSNGRRPTGLGIWFVTYGIVALLLLYVAAPAATVVFGPDYLGSIRPIRLVASCVPAFALCGLAHTFLLAAHRERLATAGFTVLLLAGSGMAFAAQYLYGSETAALMPAVSSTLAMAWLWLSLSRHLKKLDPA